MTAARLPLTRRAMLRAGGALAVGFAMHRPPRAASDAAPGSSPVGPTRCGPGSGTGGAAAGCASAEGPSPWLAPPWGAGGNEPAAAGV